MALRDLALKTLPQYEADNGPLSPAQIKQLQKSAPQAKGGKLSSSLFELDKPA
jgi:hypothetical protein